MEKSFIKLKPEQAVILLAQLNKEFKSFEGNCRLNQKAWERIQQGANDELDWAALGYTLHTIYTTMENYFLRISKAFENHLPSEAWHKHLISTMQLELPGIRPALLDEELASIADELRGFRHVFRSLYENRIDPERITLLQKKIPRLQKLFSEAHTVYCNTVSERAVSAQNI